MLSPELPSQLLRVKKLSHRRRIPVPTATWRNKPAPYEPVYSTPIRSIVPKDDIQDAFNRYHGPEFISLTLSGWAEMHAVKLEFIKPGKPTQNAFIECFNRTYRTESICSRH